MNDISDRDRRVITRMLWAFYLGALTIAVGFFAVFVITRSGLYFADALAASFAAWCVTNPLEESRLDAKIRARSRS